MENTFTEEQNSTAASTTENETHNGADAVTEDPSNEEVSDEETEDEEIHEETSDEETEDVTDEAEEA